MHDTVRLSAPAKLTLSLRVTGVRGDGLHLLDAEMVSIDLADDLTFGPGTGISLEDGVPGGLGVARVPAGPDNLVARALDAVGRRAAVRLYKRIPAGAGLGGGSSDAAAVLRWAGVPDLHTALALGSDVPFCVRGGRARVRGVGEVVDALTFEPRTFLVLLCPLVVDTASVYAAYDRRASRAVEDREARGADDADDAVGNDLEAAALEVEPALARWRDRLAARTGRRPRLAGSGSAWFVECEPGEGHDRAGPGVLDTEDGRGVVIAARTLPAAPSPGAQATV